MYSMNPMLNIMFILQILNLINMRRHLLFFMVTGLLLPAVYAQEEKKFDVELHGFVKYELTWDSRQTVAARDGNVLLFTSAPKLDANGKDINAAPELNAFGITSRLQTKIKGPDAFGAKTSGMISGDFFGIANDKVGLFRLRHAFVKLQWEHSSLLAGKYWHPLFIPEVYPLVISFGAGAPFNPLNRAPQLTYTYEYGMFKAAASLSAQQDFSSTGPAGRSPSYLMHSGLPELSGRISLHGDNFILGAAAGFWQLMPQLETAAGFATDETVPGYLVIAFAKLSLGDLSIHGSYLYGENMSQMLMLGGYGVNSVDYLTAKEEYLGIAASSMWVEMMYNLNDWCFGLFTGYTNNIGADDTISGAAFGTSLLIDDYFRVSPRIAYTSGKVTIGLEGIYHVAAYGMADKNYNIVNTEDIGAYRILGSVHYAF